MICSTFKIEVGFFTSLLGEKVPKIAGLPNLEFLQNLGILNKNTLVLRIKFRNSPETEIYLPVGIDKDANFATRLKIGNHNLEITISREDCKLTAKHWSES